jgi:indole-3-glycerol phosphate synthase
MANDIQGIHPDIPDILVRICLDTAAEVARRKSRVTIDQLKLAEEYRAPTRGFGVALKDEAARAGFALITEIKRASPSAGLIRADFDPPALARAYQAGGAACLSVITETQHFLGDPQHLRAARAAVNLPVLRKDFMLDPWQVYESRAMGADCILLIMAALTDDQAMELENIARQLDLDVLAEVHNREELDRALGLQTRLIGINNRNLKTMKTTLQTSVELAPHVPPDHLLVSESGIVSHDDVRMLADIGVQAYLVGESLLREKDVTAAARRLTGQIAED